MVRVLLRIDGVLEQVYMIQAFVLQNIMVFPRARQRAPFLPHFTVKAGCLWPGVGPSAEPGDKSLVSN
jgi:hypothetical protein